MAEADRRIAGPEISWAATALEFEGVTLRVLPLRANPYSLEKFCDGYLNIAPRICRFEPSMPFVFLLLINYGKMSQAASNLGWVAQNEVAFSVPVRWYQSRQDGWVEDQASVSPFIFVDNEQSTITGREVYGWPKVMGRLAPGVDRWTADPRAPRRLLTLETLMFSRLYAGEPLRPRLLLEVEHEAAQTPLQFPPDPANLFAPALELSRLGADALRLAWETATGGGAQLGGWLTELLAPLASGGELQGNTINVKQFRSSDLLTDQPGGELAPRGAAPGSACYQALVQAPLRFMSYRGCGLLGDVEQLRGDPSGGFRLRLRRTRSYPIVESLGLRVSGEERVNGEVMQTLQPVMPFWLSTDLRYEAGRRLCWRAEGSEWCTGSDPSPHVEPGRRLSIPYVTTAGPLAQPVEGPFDFWDASVRLVPLWADREVLQGYVERSLPPAEVTGAGVRVLPDPPAELGEGEKPPPALVLLVVSTYGKMSAPANDVGWWASRQVGFAVPIEVTPVGGEKSFPALFWAYVFNDSPLAVSTGREFTGLPTEFARFEPGTDPWLEPVGSGAGRRLMRLHAKELPAAGMGQGEEERLLLEIAEARPAPGRRPAPGWRRRGAMATPGPAAAEALGRWLEAGLAGGGLATDTDDWSSLRPVGPARGGSKRPIAGLYFDNFIMKRFRDAEDPRQPCYESLVISQTVLGRWRGRDKPPRVGVTERPLAVRLHEYPRHPIASTLGLEVEAGELGDEGARVAVVRADRRYWLKADLHHRRAQTIAWRTHDGGWQAVEKGRRAIERAAEEDTGERDLDQLLGLVRAAIADEHLSGRAQ